MKKQLLNILILFIITACNQNEVNKEQLAETSTIKTDKFEYREIFDSVEMIYNREFWGCVYGEWEITSIAKVGGSLFDESKIQNQIGNHLTIDEDLFEVDLLGGNYVLNQPSYEIEAIDNDAGPSLKGSSIFYGYQMCRDSVFYVIVNGFDSLNNEHSIYIELISCEEVSTYYDGRIYFYERIKKVPIKK